MAVISGDTNVLTLLVRNPHITNNDLASVVRANMIMVNPPRVTVTDEVYSFAVGDKMAKCFHITFSGPLENCLLSLQRFIGGAEFHGSLTDEKTGKYILGRLRPTDPGFTEAKREFEAAVAEKRRFTIAVSDISQPTPSIGFKVESSQGGCVLL